MQTHQHPEVTTQMGRRDQATLWPLALTRSNGSGTRTRGTVANTRRPLDYGLQHLRPTRHKLPVSVYIDRYLPHIAISL
jgi:hypothetical protein